MGQGEDQILWVAMVTKEVRHKTGGDISLPQASTRALMYPSLIRARRITFVPAEVFLDPNLTRYMGDVGDDTLTEIVHQMARMFS